MNANSSPLGQFETGDNQSFSLYHTDKNMIATRELMKPYLPLFKQCGSVLDIGCGPGLFLDLIREQNPACSTIGIDTDPDMVVAVQSKGFSAHQLKAQQIGTFFNCSFDGIYAGHVIEHMCGNEALGFLMDCYRLLNYGGLLVLKTPNWEHPYVRHGGFWMDITHVRPYPPQLLMKVLTDIGFSFVRAFAEQAGLQDIVAIGAKAPKDK